MNEWMNCLRGIAVQFKSSWYVFKKRLPQYNLLICQTVKQMWQHQLQACDRAMNTWTIFTLCLSGWEISCGISLSFHMPVSAVLWPGSTWGFSMSACGAKKDKHILSIAISPFFNHLFYDIRHLCASCQEICPSWFVCHLLPLITPWFKGLFVSESLFIINFALFPA